MMKNALFSRKRRFGTSFRETVTTNAVLSHIDAKRIWHQKRRFGTRFRETEITNAVLTQNDAKCTFHQKKFFFSLDLEKQ